MAEVNGMADSVVTDSQYAAPGWKSRLLAASFYCGSAPVLGYLRARREDAYASHHYKQALSVLLVLLVILVLEILVWLVISYVLVFHREYYEGTRFESTLFMIVRRLFLCWLVVWAFSIAWALLGSWGSVPLIGRLARFRFPMNLSLVGCTAVTVVLAVIFSATVHATILTRHDEAPAKVYMLYDDVQRYPRWVFNLGFYFISRASVDRWGPGSVVVAPLTKEDLARALVEGKFIFLSSHGTKDGLITRDFRIRPEEAAPFGIGEDLQFVYITGCDSGTLVKQWKRTFAPAEVVTFDRLSAVLEHVYWLYFRGVRKVRELE